MSETTHDPSVDPSADRSADRSSNASDASPTTARELSVLPEGASTTLVLGVGLAAVVGTVIGTVLTPWIGSPGSGMLPYLRAMVVIVGVALAGLLYGRYLLLRTVEDEVIHERDDLAAHGSGAAPSASGQVDAAGKLHTVPGGVEIYQSTLMHIWEDGIVTDKEARTLDDLRARLGVTEREHEALEAEVQDVLFPNGLPEGGAA